MAWIRRSYSRSSRRAQRSKSKWSLVIGIVIAAIAIIWLISLN
jgi:hypothetical protein